MLSLVPQRNSGRLAAAIAALALLAIGLTVGPASAVILGLAPLASWGENIAGQLGTGTLAYSRVPVAVVASGPLAGKTIVQVSAGYRHACAVTSDGLLACWGDNTSGQLGIGSTASSSVPVAVTGGALAGLTVTSVSAGLFHTCAVAGGAAYCWGSNADSQLGTRWGAGSNVPVAVYGGGELAGRTVTAIAAGDQTSCAVAGGAAYCWGDNDRGEVGDGTLDRRDTPVQVFLGTAGSPGFLHGKTVQQVTVGHSHACARTDGGGLACWGTNDHGELGVATGSPSPCAFSDCSTVPVAVTASTVPGSGFLADRGVASVDAGGSTTCAVTLDGAATCWGLNDYGQVGDGSTVDRPVPVAVSSSTGALAGKALTDISLGRFHACARGLTGSLACWGSNDNGLLGVETTASCAATPCSAVPLQVAAGAGGAGSGVLAGTSVIGASAGDTFTLAFTAMGVITPPGVPGAPTGVRATAGDAQAVVAWTAPPSNGGLALSTYSVQKSTDNGATWSAATTAPVPASASTVTVTGLGNGVPVIFRVAATNAVGTGPWSTASSPVTPATPTSPPGPTVTVPGAPTGVVASPGSATATVTWIPPASTGGQAVASYLVQKSTDTGATWTPATSGPIATPATTTVVTGLANGVAVSFRVAATNSAGTGAWSAPSVPVTPRAAVAPPGKVTRLTAVSARPRRATFAWRSPASGGLVTGYQWRIRKGSSPYTGWTTIPRRQFMLTLTGLVRGASYTFAVRGRNAAGAGPESRVTIRIAG